MLKNTADALGNTILLRCLPCKLTCWTYACHCLQTGHAQDNSDEDDNTEPTHQSPWELFDEGLDAQQAVQEGPALDSPVTDRLKHAVQALSASEHFELFVDLVDPDAAYPASDTGWTLLSSALLCHAVLAAMSLILLPSHTSTVWCRPGIWMLRELLSPKTSDIRNFLSSPYIDKILALGLNCYMAMMTFPPGSRPDTACHVGALMYYNTMVALPMSLSLIKDQLEQGYYRQVQGVMGDVATIQGNAQAFNGEDSQVADMAAGHPPLMLRPCNYSLRRVHLTTSCLVYDWASKPTVCLNMHMCCHSKAGWKLNLCHAHQSALILSVQVCIAASF